MSRQTDAQKAQAVECFRRGCRAALLELDRQPTEAERYEAARVLGRLHWLPEPQRSLTFPELPSP